MTRSWRSLPTRFVTALQEGICFNQLKDIASGQASSSDKEQHVHIEQPFLAIGCHIMNTASYPMLLNERGYALLLHALAFYDSFRCCARLNRCHGAQGKGLCDGTIISCTTQGGFPEVLESFPFELACSESLVPTGCASSKPR